MSEQPKATIRTNTTYGVEIIRPSLRVDKSEIGHEQKERERDRKESKSFFGVGPGKGGGTGGGRGI